MSPPEIRSKEVEVSASCARETTPPLFSAQIPGQDPGSLKVSRICILRRPLSLPRRPSLDRINALYRDVKPGDRYSLTYLPGRGTELALNGEPLGLIAGSDFASAYFSIWLGPKPLDAALKAQLLSCTREVG